MMEGKYGKANRVWVTDCGIVSEENLEFLRKRGALYLVGTPKSMLRRHEADLLEVDGWQTIREGLEVKLAASPDGADEHFVLCRACSLRVDECAERMDWSSLAHGAYLLRTNHVCENPAELWKRLS
jgi:hypothetical protein